MKHRMGTDLVTRLPNGVQVVVTPNTASPLAAVYLWMEAGSVDERPGEEGAAHFLEHMVFKGTKRRGVGEPAGEIEGLGGDLNAYTTYEQTCLHATVLATASEQALDVLVDMLRHSVIDPAEFDREKQVILEEIRMYLDDPETQVSDTSLAHLYPNHAYGRPVVGTLDSIGPMSRDKLVGFWNRAYRPDRLIVSVAGDVDPKAIVAATKTLLGDWKAPRPVPRTIPDAKPARAVVRRLAEGFETTSVSLAWRTLPYGHPDIAALDVLAAGLGEGASSALPVRLQLEDGLASEVSAGLSARPGGGDLAVHFLPREGATAEALEACFEELAGVARSGLSTAEVTRCKQVIDSDFLFGTETVDGIAHDAAFYTARSGDPSGRAAYRAAIAAVTVDDVKRVAKAWLDPARAVVVAMDKELEDRALTRAARPPARIQVKRPPGPVEHRTANGVRVWVLPEDVPVAAVRVVGMGGALAVGPRHAGIHTMWGRAVTAGAGDLDATAFAEELDAVAGTLAGISGRNTVGLGATFPADRIVEGLDLVGSVLVEPRFDPEDVDRVREELVEELRTRQDRPGQIAEELGEEALWPGHPWRLPETGTAASLKKITGNALAKWHESLLTADNVVVAVAGGVDVDDVLANLEPWLLDLPPGPCALEPRGALAPPKAGRIQRRAGREQAWVTWSARAAPLHHPDRYALEVAGAILGAQGGRLFLDLRERRGLAYSVWATAIHGVDAGMFTAGLATEPGRADEARAELLAALATFAAHGPTDAEVDRARRMLIGHAAMGLQRAYGRAGDRAMATLYGYAHGLDGYRAALAPLDAAKVAAVARAVLTSPAVEVVVLPETSPSA